MSLMLNSVVSQSPSLNGMASGDQVKDGTTVDNRVTDDTNKKEGTVTDTMAPESQTEDSPQQVQTTAPIKETPQPESVTAENNIKKSPQVDQVFGRGALDHGGSRAVETANAGCVTNGSPKVEVKDAEISKEENTKVDTTASKTQSHSSSPARASESMADTNPPEATPELVEKESAAMEASEHVADAKPSIEEPEAVSKTTPSIETAKSVEDMSPPVETPEPVAKVSPSIETAKPEGNVNQPAETPVPVTKTSPVGAPETLEKSSPSAEATDPVAKPLPVETTETVIKTSSAPEASDPVAKPPVEIVETITQASTPAEAKDSMPKNSPVETSENVTKTSPSVETTFSEASTKKTSTRKKRSREPVEVNLDESRPKRSRSQTQHFQSPTILEGRTSSLDTSSTSSTTSSLLYEKYEFLAVRNDESGFYICRSLQNVYKPRPFLIEWLDTKDQEVYDLTATCQKIQPATVLAATKLKKVKKSSGRGAVQYILDKKDKDLIEEALKHSIQHQQKKQSP